MRWTMLAFTLSELPKGRDSKENVDKGGALDAKIWKGPTKHT